MATELNFLMDDTTLLASRAGIDQEFLDKINQVVTDIRKVKLVHPGVGEVVANLTSPSGEVFVITVG
jgi:hypothetical protein